MNKPVSIEELTELVERAGEYCSFEDEANRLIRRLSEALPSLLAEVKALRGREKALREALATLDEADKDCPVKRSRTYLSVCPTCSATTDDPCRLNVVGLVKFENALRLLVHSEKVDG